LLEMSERVSPPQPSPGQRTAPELCRSDLP